MINERQIVRLIGTSQHGLLIDRVLSNGRCHCNVIRSLLMQTEALETAAYGLALQRICEISYRPSADAKALAMRLVSSQRSDGLFGPKEAPASNAMVAASAIGTRGLVSLASSTNEFHQSTSDESVFHQAIDLGIAAIVQQFPSQNHDDATSWAIVLWQLGDLPKFRSRVIIEDFLTMLNNLEADQPHNDLYRFAHAMAA